MLCAGQLDVEAAQMRIRNASRTEADQLNTIAMQAKAHWGYTADQLEQWRESLSTDSQSIEQWPTFVAEDQGNAIGFTQINSDLEIWELVSLFVLPEHIGRGVGRALLKEAVAIANRAGQSTLHIDSDPNAEPFYLACGAVRIGAELVPIQDNSSRVRPQLHLYTSAV
jgi:GNAT superfamily N-acetyltransferase